MRLAEGLASRRSRTPAAALPLTPIAMRYGRRKRGRFFWRTIIASIRPRIWASMTPSRLTASSEHDR